MKKLDEMGRHIRLRSEEYAFKFLLLALSLWTLFECCSAFLAGGSVHILPTLILATAVAIQGFSETILKRKMILDDEEYQQPNQVLWSIVLWVALAAIVVSVGFYILHL